MSLHALQIHIFTQFTNTYLYIIYKVHDLQIHIFALFTNTYLYMIYINITLHNTGYYVYYMQGGQYDAEKT